MVITGIPFSLPALHEEKLPYLELADKFCGKFKNLVFLILIMWYT